MIKDFTMYKYRADAVRPGSLYPCGKFVMDEKKVVYLLSCMNSYIIGSVDVDPANLEPCGEWGDDEC